MIEKVAGVVGRTWVWVRHPGFRAWLSPAWCVLGAGKTVALFFLSFLVCERGVIKTPVNAEVMCTRFRASGLARGSSHCPQRRGPSLRAQEGPWEGDLGRCPKEESVIRRPVSPGTTGNPRGSIWRGREWRSTWHPPRARPRQGSSESSQGMVGLPCSEEGDSAVFKWPLRMAQVQPDFTLGLPTP